MDEALLIAINHGLNHPVVDGLLAWVSQRLTFSYPLLLALLGWSLYRAGRRGGWWFLTLGLTVGAADIGSNQLKAAFGQYRPCYTMADRLLPTGGDSSAACSATRSGMPSNHAANFIAATVFVTLTTPWRKWQIGLWLTTLLVALSRIYLGKHYPSQVLVGLELGSVAGILGAWATIRLGLADPRRRMLDLDAPDEQN